MHYALGIGFGCVAAMTAYSNFVLDRTRSEITYKNLDPRLDGFKILHLSDLHGRVFGSNNESILAHVRRCDPDIVVMTGDMIDGDGKNYVFLSLAGALAKRYPVYNIRGNHEQRLYQRSQATLYDHLRAIGVKTLDNTSTLIRHKGAALRLSGVWSNRIYHRDPSPGSDDRIFGPKDIEAAIGACDTSVFNILLIHTPAFFDACARWGADLTLCGHMHGGMIRLPLLGGVLSPYRRVFPHYDGGVYIHKGKVMCVSRGLGNGNAGLRFLNRPELSLITLKSEGDVKR